MSMLDLATLAEKMRRSVLETFDVDPGEIRFEYPPKVELGDLALNFPFNLAKSLRRAPRQIAQEFIEKSEVPDGISRMEAAGAGYINLFLNREQIAIGLISGRNEDVPPLNNNTKITVEHSSINPNKAAHIGHLRNSCLGDTLARILKYLRYPITVQNYIDDTGVQVADVVVGFMHIENLTREEIIAIPEPFDHFCWDLYARVKDFYAENEANLELKKKALHSMESGSGVEAEIGEVVADRIVKCHLKTMERLGISYDLLVWEGDILKHKFWDKAFKLLKQSGVIYLAEDGKNKGCWVMDLSESEAFANMDDPDKIIVRSDGTVTYVGKDIAYHLWKLGLLDKEFEYRKYNVDHDQKILWTTTSETELVENYKNLPAQSIFNVIDVGQEYPQKVVAESIRALAGDEAAQGYNHFSYEKVALTPASCLDLGVELNDEEKKKTFIAMSGRRGLGVKADDLVNLLIEKATKEVAERNPEFTPEEVELASRQLAVGALRYYMIKFTRKQVLAFDFDTALSFEGESGPYLTYALVRANNILNKLEEVDGMTEDKIDQLHTGVDWSLIQEDESANETWEIIALLARLKVIAEDAVNSLELSMFCKHVYLLAQKFNTWYHKYQILHEQEESLKRFRIVVLKIFRDYYKVALELMGIEAPKRM